MIDSFGQMLGSMTIKLAEHCGFLTTTWYRRAEAQNRIRVSKAYTTLR